MCRQPPQLQLDIIAKLGSLVIKKETKSKMRERSRGYRTDDPKSKKLRNSIPWLCGLARVPYENPIEGILYHSPIGRMNFHFFDLYQKYLVKTSEPQNP